MSYVDDPNAHLYCFFDGHRPKRWRGRVWMEDYPKGIVVDVCNEHKYVLENSEDSVPAYIGPKDESANPYSIPCAEGGTTQAVDEVEVPWQEGHMTYVVHICTGCDRQFNKLVMSPSKKTVWVPPHKH